MLTKLEPLNFQGKALGELEYFRLLRIGAGENEGYILGTQNIVNGRKILFKIDLESLKRRLSHVEANQTHELQTLGSIRRVLENARANLDHWKSLDEEDLTLIRSSLATVTEELEFVRNEDKVAMKEKIERSLTLRDSTGRYNPTVTYRRLGDAIRFLNDRVKDIEGMIPYIALDKAKVTQLAETEMEPVTGFLHKVEKWHDKFKVLAPGHSLTDQKKEEILANLEELKGDALSQKYEPYRSFGLKIAAHIQKTIDALSEDYRVTAANEFTKVYVIAKLERAYKEIMHVMEQISVNPQIAHPADLMTNLQNAYSHLSAHEVAPSVVTEDYNGAYIRMYHLINSLKKRLREINEDAKFPEPEKSSLEKLMERVSKIPAVGRVVSEIHVLLQRFFPKPTPAPTEPLVSRATAYAKMKDRISDFDFSLLAKSLR